MFKIEKPRYAFICFLGFLIYLVSYNPGFMSPDTLSQYEQARGAYYGTWHPPVIAFLWHWLNLVREGPQLMLVFQLVLLWTSCYLLGTLSDDRKWRITVFALFFIAPFIQNFSGFIIKDTHLALAWLLGVSIIIKGAVRGSISTGAAIISAILLMYGTWSRHNAPSGLLTLCIAWAWVVFLNRRWLVKAVCAFALFASILVGGKVFNAAINVWKEYPECILYMHDLAGIYTKTGKDVFPSYAYTSPSFDTAFIRQNYHPSSIDPIWWKPGEPLLIPDKKAADALHGAWVKAVKSNFNVYLSNRYETFLYFLKIKDAKNEYYPYFLWIHPNQYEIVHKERFLYKAFAGLMRAERDMFYFSGWFWVLVNIVLLAIATVVKNKLYRVVYLSLGFSALFYWLPQFFLATTHKDFRYLYWVCLACFLSALILWLDKLSVKDKVSPQQVNPDLKRDSALIPDGL